MRYLNDNRYFPVKATLKRPIFKTDLKFSRDVSFLILTCNRMRKVWWGCITNCIIGIWLAPKKGVPAIVYDWMT